jgi:hypothetical protein
MTGSGNSIDSRSTRVRGGDRVTGGGVLQPHERDDVAGHAGGVLLAVVGVHLQDAADPLLGVLGDVHDVGAGLEHARVDPGEGQGADVGVGHDLEGQRGEGLVVGGVALDVLARLRVRALDRGDLERRGQVVDDGVEQGLHALVLEGGAAQHGHELVVDRRLAQTGLELLHGELAVLEEGLEQVLVGLGDLLHQLGAVHLGLLAQVLGDLDVLEGGAEVLALPDDALVLDEVDHALQVALDADRDLDAHGVGGQTLA